MTPRVGRDDFTGLEIEVDGIVSQTGVCYPRPDGTPQWGRVGVEAARQMFQLIDDERGWAAARWCPKPPTEKELDRYVRYGHLPQWLPLPLRGAR